MMTTEISKSNTELIPSTYSKTNLCINYNLIIFYFAVEEKLRLQSSRLLLTVKKNS